MLILIFIMYFDLLKPNNLLFILQKNEYQYSDSFDILVFSLSLANRYILQNSTRLYLHQLFNLIGYAIILLIKNGDDNS